MFVMYQGAEGKEMALSPLLASARTISMARRTHIQNPALFASLTFNSIVL